MEYIPLSRFAPSSSLEWLRPSGRGTQPVRRGGPCTAAMALAAHAPAQQPMMGSGAIE